LIEFLNCQANLCSVELEAMAGGAGSSIGSGPDAVAKRIAADWQYLQRELEAAQRPFDSLDPLLLSEGRVVDGNDLLAVYEVTRDAVSRARAGEGPTLIESVTYRMSFHNTTDNPSRYQDPAELEEARGRDPIKRVQAYLAERGLWNAERQKEFSEAAAAEIDEAMAQAQQAPPPQPSQIFDHIFAELTPRQAAQRSEMLGR